MFDKVIDIGNTPDREEVQEIENSYSPADNLILLVEDNEIHCQLISAALEAICHVDIASNGEEALDMAARSTYPAILMDINLGSGISGVETTQQIRRIPRYRITPIIAITGFLVNGDPDKLLTSGFSFYIEKPFPINHLRTVVSDILGLRGQC
ncbi:MAG TPA: response regulator [Williamwhitmania sp.]|nr:response regulator [Williamwhitmania sp.]